jgi:hypothetical protein
VWAGALAAGDRPDYDKRFLSGCDGRRQWSVGWVQGEIFLASKEAQERAALLRDVVADGASQHRITSFESIKYRALGGEALNFKFQFVPHMSQRAEMLREYDSDHILLN